jgi:hypothetical protein
MKLTYSLLILISLSSLLICQRVEVWVDKEFKSKVGKLCDTYTEIVNSDKALSNIDKVDKKDEIKSQLSAVHEEDVNPLPLGENPYVKCPGELKQEWITRYPIALNVIRNGNGKGILFITYFDQFKDQKYIHPDALVGENVLFTRFITKGVRHFLNTFSSSVSLEPCYNEFSNAVTLMRKKIYEKAKAGLHRLGLNIYIIIHIWFIILMKILLTLIIFYMKPRMRDMMQSKHFLNKTKQRTK